MIQHLIVSFAEFLAQTPAHDNNQVYLLVMQGLKGLLDTLPINEAFADPDGQEDKRIAWHAVHEAVKTSSGLDTPIKRLSAELSMHSNHAGQPLPASVQVAGPAAVSGQARQAGKRARRLSFKATQKKPAARTAATRNLSTAYSSEEDIAIAQHVASWRAESPENAAADCVPMSCW